jgi:hypothetical protein
VLRAARAPALSAAVAIAIAGIGVVGSGCRDVSRFSSKGDRFEGAVVKGSFVRSGVIEDARMCLTLDTDHLQDAPGALTTTDGRFRLTPLRPIPQFWHDPLSTFTFGDGRVQNLMYAATPMTDAGSRSDILVIVSLMQTDHIEVRLLRGAPETDAGPSGAPAPGAEAAVFGVFNLDRQPGPCSF